MFLLQNGKGIFTDGVDDWATLGNISDLACLTNTNKCTAAGATVMFWTKFPDCGNGIWRPIISSIETGWSPGFNVQYKQNHLG